MSGTFSQLCVLVKDFQKSFDFYSQVLNLTFKDGSEKGPYAAFSASPSTDIALFDHSLMMKAIKKDNPEQHAESKDDAMVVVLRVPDVEAAKADLERKGVGIVCDVTERSEWGLKSLHIRAPEGTLIELCEYK